MTRLLLTLVLVACAVSTAVAGRFDPMKPLAMPQGMQVLFTPDDNIEARIVELIGAAQSEILVNQYAITSRAIATALVEAYTKRKVYVGIVLEGQPAVTNYQTPQYFLINSVPVVILQGREGRGLNNNKYFVIDRQVVVTGSFDCTRAAATRNDENVIIITDVAVAVAYYNHWARMLAQGKIPQPLTSEK